MARIAQDRERQRGESHRTQRPRVLFLGGSLNNPWWSLDQDNSQARGSGGTWNQIFQGRGLRMDARGWGGTFNQTALNVKEGNKRSQKSENSRLQISLQDLTT